MTSSPRHFRGFTLVELLVVIGVISVLISLLLPAMSRSRQQASSLVCLSNLKQMGMAALQYANNNRGYFPISSYGWSVRKEWDFEIVTDANGVARVIPGILWAGAGTTRIQQCPSCDIKSPTVTDPYTGYNYNVSYIGHGIGEAVERPAKVVSIRRPTEVALFGDGQYSGGTNKFMRAPVTESASGIGDSVTATTRIAGTQGYRHMGKTNLCFVDGHAETWPARFTQTGPIIRNASAGTGFISADNRAYGMP